nr:unnamed protein product [Callosobruchus analis]
MDKYGTAPGGGDIWPAPVPDMPKIVSLDVKCEKSLMKVYIGFDKPFYGIVFSKGLGRTSAHFEIGIHACGTSGNTENGLYGYGAESGSGTYFENIIVIQYDPQIKNFGASASVLSYAHFQAFKFPDSMEVHFQCTIQICRYHCPDQCADGNSLTHNGLLDVPHSAPDSGYGIPPPPPGPIDGYLHPGRPRDERRTKRALKSNPEKEVGVNKEELVNGSMICMTTPGFAATLVVLLAILIVSCLMSAFLCIKLKPLSNNKLGTVIGYSHSQKGKSKSCFYS